MKLSAFGGLARGMVVLAVVGVFAACAAPIPEGRGRSTSKIDGRWTPPQSDASGEYEGLDGEGCATGLKPGARALGDQLKSQFGITYGGFSCRANTANSSQLSIHAVGRALDVMTSGETGDEIANHVVTNASTLGVDLVIWNHTLWKITPSGATSRAYSGPNPHTDHVHIEITRAIAENGPGTVTPGEDGSQTTPGDEGDTTTPGSSSGGTTTPGSSSGGTTTPGYDDTYGEYPGGDPWFDQLGEGELECRVSADCDPSGIFVCDSGFCM